MGVGCDILVSICVGSGTRCLGPYVRDVLGRATGPSRFIVMRSKGLTSSYKGVVRSCGGNGPRLFRIMGLRGGRKLTGTLGRKVGRYEGRLITEVSTSSISLPAEYRGRLGVFRGCPRLTMYKYGVSRFDKSFCGAGLSEIMPDRCSSVVGFFEEERPFGRPAMVVGGDIIGGYNKCVGLQEGRSFSLFSEVIATNCCIEGVSRSLCLCETSRGGCGEQGDGRGVGTTVCICGER